MTPASPPPCLPWCNVHRDDRWEITPTATTRTCERRIVVETGGERHEIVLQRFAAIEFGHLRVDPPIVRNDAGEAISLDHAMNLADALCRIIDLADEPHLVA